jgi:hypothetical protein
VELWPKATEDDRKDSPWQCFVTKTILQNVSNWTQVSYESGPLHAEDPDHQIYARAKMRAVTAPDLVDRRFLAAAPIATRWPT